MSLGTTLLPAIGRNANKWMVALFPVIRDGAPPGRLHSQCFDSEQAARAYIHQISDGAFERATITPFAQARLPRRIKRELARGTLRHPVQGLKAA